MAVVDSTGLVTGVAAGQVQVTATAAGLTGRAELAVVTPLPTTVAVTPDTVVLTAVGQTAQLTAEVRDQAGRVMEGVPVVWLSAETTVAAVDASGLVTAVGSGAVTITATAGEASGDALVTVEIDLDRAALVALYNATDGPNWVDNTNWLTDAPLGEWYGVTTDGRGRVVRLDLSAEWNFATGGPGRHGLRGQLPPELGSLSNLTHLDLGLNELTGSIPPELGGLSELRLLNLGLNELTGSIPPELGGLSNLRYLHLRSNGLTGPIPPELGGLSNLWRLNLFYNQLTGPIPPELGALSNLQELHLGSNELTGPVPPELGGLSNLTFLAISNNELAGPIPPELGNLTKLGLMGISGGNELGALPSTFLNLRSLRRAAYNCSVEGMCVPGTSDFVDWVAGLEDGEAGVDLLFCNASDEAALTALYEVTGGDDWTDSRGWLGGPALGEWHGVEADSLGRITALDLTDNGLSGVFPAGLASLGELTSLRIGGNDFGGRLPLALTALDLDEFHYDGTGLCEPDDPGFRAWLDGIPSHRGTSVQCEAVTEREALAALYATTGGPGWANRSGWLTAAPLSNWHGVQVDDQGRVVGLSLSWNGLAGRIPPELRGLTELRYLDLGGNDLSGPIPPELRELSNLTALYLGRNELSGPMPPELRGLTKLRYLDLGGNDLSGPIPPELRELSNLTALYLGGNEPSGPMPPELRGLTELRYLDLGGNDLSGPIPPEFGNLANLTRLYLDGNQLTGPIPATFGELANLTELVLSRNAGLAGAVPAGLLDLSLESFVSSGTELCVPGEAAFREWLAGIPERWIAQCEGAAAYLVQAVQSRTHPVPLVAGEDALLRVFVTAAMETEEGIPAMRARVYLNGSERHVLDIAGSPTPIPTEIDEGELSKSANAEVPGWLVREGLEMVVEIDTGGTLDASLGVPARIPEEGRLAVEVHEMPVLDLTVIPFLWTSDPDSAVVGLTEGMAADPEGHDLLEETRVLLPVAGIDVTAHAPVASASNSAFDLLRETEAIRVLEGGGGHYMGTMLGSVRSAAGVAYIPGRSIFSRPISDVIAHELGHNMSLGHAPCGGAPGPDRSFPYPRGNIGAWGYDFDRGQTVPTLRKDHMSYCDPMWTSDYDFVRALRHRLADERAEAAALAAPTTSLLLWGGVDTTGTPFLNPAFVAAAPPALPDSAGDYTVTGRDAAGRELFSLNFAMQVALAEEAETSSFVFALPVRPGWAEALASVTLSGPDGEATLDDGSDLPMAILRDPRTGQVRGFLRDMPDPASVRAYADGPGPGLPTGLDILFSRGIPDGEAWRR